MYFGASEPIPADFRTPPGKGKGLPSCLQELGGRLTGHKAEGLEGRDVPGGWQEPERRGTALWWAAQVTVSRSVRPEYGESERGCRRGRQGPGSLRVLKTEWRSLVFSGGQGEEGH